MKSGLRIRAVGENPQAADAQGINIYKIRYLSVFASGILAGIGGVIFFVTTSASFVATVAGMGFLAITSRNSRAPKAIGQIYEMGKR